jgi:hypothetical protein
LAAGCTSVPGPTMASGDVIALAREKLESSNSYLGSDADRTRFFGIVTMARYLTRRESVRVGPGIVPVEAGIWLIEVRGMAQEQTIQSGEWVVKSERSTGLTSYFTYNESTDVFRPVHLPGVQPAPTARQTAAPTTTGLGR